MGSRYSVPGVEDTVRVDVAGCIWMAYIFLGMFALQAFIMAGLAARWHLMGGKAKFEASEAAKGGAGNSIELPNRGSFNTA